MNPDSSSDSSLTLRHRLRTATRGAILDAAAELLSAEGATHTRIEDIASRAGVAVGTVYNYFEDRATLVSALLETRTRALLEVLDTPPVQPTARRGQAQPTPQAAFQDELERFVAALGAHFDRNRFLLTVLVEEEAHRGIDARAASRRRTLLSELLGRAEQLMDRGIKTRALRKESPAMFAALLIGMIRGVALAALSQGGEFAAAGTAAIVRTFMEGAGR
jgi:AcrR family transcriptional regulator